MRIKQGLIKVVFGSKEQGPTHFVWWRISRAKLDKLSDRLSSQPNFYYAKIYEYVRTGNKQGYVTKQLAYVYWKNGILTSVIN